MAAHLPLFSLRLGVGRTIGHQTLHTIWLRASRSADVTVSRTLLSRQGADCYLYTFSGTRQIQDLVAVEGEHRLPQLHQLGDLRPVGGEYLLRVQGNDESGEGGAGFQCCWTNTYVKVTVK